MSPCPTTYTYATPYTYVTRGLHTATFANVMNASCACVLMMHIFVQAVFFLGDGGWSANDLIREASNAIPARITLHGIAFFIGGGDDGGLSTIAAMTGGGFRNITDARQVTEAEPVEAVTLIRGRGSR